MADEEDGRQDAVKMFQAIFAGLRLILFPYIDYKIIDNNKGRQYV